MKLYEKDDNALIGLCGKKGAGKSTVADILVNVFGFQRRYAFATPLKKMVDALCDEAGVDKPEKEKPIEVFGGKTMRELYQTLGTEWGRNLIDDNLWVKILSKNVAEDFAHWEMSKYVFGQSIRQRQQYDMGLFGPNTFRVVIEDVRFPNEFEYIKSNIGALSGHVLQIVNPSVKDNEYSEHVSEKLFDTFIPDEVIDNDSSKAMLVEEIKYLLPREWFFWGGD